MKFMNNSKWIWKLENTFLNLLEDILADLETECFSLSNGTYVKYIFLFKEVCNTVKAEETLPQFKVSFHFDLVLPWKHILGMNAVKKKIFWKNYNKKM